MNVGCTFSDSGFGTITYTLLFSSLVDRVASFPGLPTVQFLIACSGKNTPFIEKHSTAPVLHGANHIFDGERGKRGKKTLLPCTRGWETWTVGRPWNEAIDRVYAVVLGGGGGGGVT